MDRAGQFLKIYNESNDYRERLLSLYNGLFLIHKDSIWEIIEERGISRERMEDALLYVREDEERGGKSVLDEKELSLLKNLLAEHIKTSP